MSLTLKLSDEEATALQAKAAADGLSLEEWLRKLAQPEPATTVERPLQTAADIILSSMQSSARDYGDNAKRRREPE